MMTMTQQPELEKYIRNELRDCPKFDVDCIVSNIASTGILQTEDSVQPWIQSCKDIDMPLGLLELCTKELKDTHYGRM